MVVGFKQVRVSSVNLVPSLSTENHLLLHFWQVREQALFAVFRKCPLAKVQHCGIGRSPSCCQNFDHPRRNVHLVVGRSKTTVFVPTLIAPPLAPVKGVAKDIILWTS